MFFPFVALRKATNCGDWIAPDAFSPVVVNSELNPGIVVTRGDALSKPLNGLSEIAALPEGYRDIAGGAANSRTEGSL
jgi:hypothetical protein